MKTTLNKIKDHSPCEDGWKKLLKFLNKTEADDEEFSLLTILESNGLNHALWALIAVDGFDKEKRLMACDFAESVIHLMEDNRSLKAIEVSRAYANGLATIKELISARVAAMVAYNDAYDDVYAVFSAAAAAEAEADSAAAAARAAAAAWAADTAEAARAAKSAELEKQVEIFKKYVK